MDFKFFWPLFFFLTTFYKVVMANVLANNCLFTHLADKQQRSHSFERIFLVT